MNDSKKWYQSKTIIFQIITAIAHVVNALFNFEINPDEVSKISEAITQIANGLYVGGMILLVQLGTGIYGRKTATKIIK